MTKIQKISRWFKKMLQDFSWKPVAVSVILTGIVPVFIFTLPIIVPPGPNAHFIEVWFTGIKGKIDSGLLLSASISITAMTVINYRGVLKEIFSTSADTHQYNKEVINSVAVKRYLPVILAVVVFGGAAYVYGGLNTGIGMGRNIILFSTSVILQVLLYAASQIIVGYADIGTVRETLSRESGEHLINQENANVSEGVTKVESQLANQGRLFEIPTPTNEVGNE